MYLNVSVKDLNLVYLSIISCNEVCIIWYQISDSRFQDVLKRVCVFLCFRSTIADPQRGTHPHSLTNYPSEMQTHMACEMQAAHRPLPARSRGPYETMKRRPTSTATQDKRHAKPLLCLQQPNYASTTATPSYPLFRGSWLT